MAESVRTTLLLLLGGMVGTGCRYWTSVVVQRWLQQPTFPYATVAINVIGSFLMGLIAEFFETRMLLSPAARIAVLTGVLGGFTTYSSFSYETYALLRDGERWLALVNVLGTVVLGLAAVWIGMRIGRALW